MYDLFSIRDTNLFLLCLFYSLTFVCFVVVVFFSFGFKLNILSTVVFFINIEFYLFFFTLLFLLSQSLCFSINSSDVASSLECFFFLRWFFVQALTIRLFDVCKFNILVVLIYSFNTQFYDDILGVRKKERKNDRSTINMRTIINYMKFIVSGSLFIIR